MTAIALNPMVVAVSPNADATITRITDTEHGGGGGLKKVVGVVAAIAIPIAAPAIASSIAASGFLGAAVSSAMVTTAGAVVSSAIVGAGLGAITAKVTGGDVRAGAITGAIGGGIGGYSSASKGMFGTEQGGISATADRTLGTNFSGDATTAEGGLTQTGSEGLTGAEEQTLTDASYAPTSEGDVASQLSNTSSAPTNMQTVSTQNVGGTQYTNVGQDTGLVGAGSGGGATAEVGFGQQFMDTVSATGSKIVDKVTDPDALANLTMQAGGQLLGTAMAGDPDMPPEQKELLEMRKAELAALKERDEAAFNAQMDAARQYLQQARAADPTYFATQAANKEAIEQQRKIREQQRRAGLSRGRGISAAEQRRMQLDAARNVSSQYDTGFRQGMALQDRAMSGYQGAMQGAAYSGSKYSNALAGLQRDYDAAMTNAYNARDTRAQNISDMFAGFNTTSGNTKQQEEALGGLNTTTAPEPKKDEDENNGGLPDGMQFA